MADQVENMVLRTIYLPLEVDRQLRAFAFTRDVSKGELMREMIKQGLSAIIASGERSLAEQVSARVAQVQLVAVQKKPNVAKSARSPRVSAEAARKGRVVGKERLLSAAG